MRHWLRHFFTSIQTDEYGFCLGQCCSPEREWVGELCISLPMEELSWLEFLECLSHHLGVRTFSHTLPCMASGAKISKAEAANWGPYAIYLELVCQIHSVGSRVLDLAIGQRHPCCWYKSSKSFSRRKRASSWVSGGLARGLWVRSSHGFGAQKRDFQCPQWWILYFDGSSSPIFLQLLGIGLSILRHWSNLSMIPIPVVLLFLRGPQPQPLKILLPPSFALGNWQFGAVQERSVEKARVVFAQLLLTLTKFANPQLKIMIFDKVLKKWRDIKYNIL